MKKVAALFLSMVLLGCSTEPQHAGTTSHFNIPQFVDDLVLNMSGQKLTVSKTFTLNGNTETKKINPIDSAFWARELSRLKEIDLNAPQYRDNLIITNQPDSLSNLQVRVYTLKEQKNIPLQSLAIYYLQEPAEIRQVKLELATNNFIASTKTSCALWLNRYGDKLLIDSLKITGADDMILQAARSYRATSKTVW